MQVLPIEGQFYNSELVKFTVSHVTEFQMGIIMGTLNKSGTKQHPVMWSGYDETLNLL